MTGTAVHAQAGKWRIVSADLWDRDHLELCGPALITIATDGTGEIYFRALPPALRHRASRLRGQT